MTFTEQILGVPPALIEHGWRRAPDKEIEKAWNDGLLNARKGHYWQWYMAPSPYNFMLARPMHTTQDCWHIKDFVLNAYAHEGWGDGLAPTPEMVKVWKWWWVSREDGPQAVKVAPSGAVYQGVFGWTEIVAEDRALFLGPVLPPVRQS